MEKKRKIEVLICWRAYRWSTWADEVDPSLDLGRVDWIEYVSCLGVNEPVVHATLHWEEDDMEMHYRWSEDADQEAREVSLAGLFQYLMPATVARILTDLEAFVHEDAFAAQVSEALSGLTDGPCWSHGDRKELHYTLERIRTGKEEA